MAKITGYPNFALLADPTVAAQLKLVWDALQGLQGSVDALEGGTTAATIAALTARVTKLEQEKAAKANWPPRCILARSSNFTLTTAVEATVDGWYGEIDSDGMARSAGATCKVPGMYLLGAVVHWAANATGNRYAAIRIDGTNIWYSTAVPLTGQDTSISVPRPIRLQAGQLVQLRAYQNSGGDLALDRLYTRLWALWVGPY